MNRTSMARLAAFLTLYLLGCQDPQSGPTPPTTAPAVTAQPTVTASSSPVQPVVHEPRGDAERGKKLVAEHECHRCHDGLDEVGTIAAESHCFHCHAQILEGRFKDKPDHPKWRKNVAHLTAAPSLASAGKRFSYDWLVGFVAEPHDLRPGLTSEMPRLALTKEQARDVATWLADRAEPGFQKPEEVKLDGADLAHGRKLLEDKGCGSCHLMSGAPPLPSPPTSSGPETRVAVALAPDLRGARERLDASIVVAWIQKPQLMKPGTPMPETAMTAEEARDLAAYVLRGELAPLPAKTVPAPLPLLDRKVTYDEVEERVLGKICRHCHGNPDEAVGDGGPGNTGGFGFKGRGLQLTSYERVMAGFKDDKGERQSVFQPLDGQPRIVTAMLARWAEEAGQPNPNVRGMPLGLPPMSLEDIQLMASWIAQGRKR